MSGRRKFGLDKANGKWMGVCSGIANYFGWDATLVRVGAVVVTLLGAFPWTLIAYIATGLIAKSKGHGALDGGYSRRTRVSTYDLNHKLSDVDRRMAEVDSYVAHSNVRLAREIEELR